MNDALSSRERLLRSIDLEEPDHIPLWLRFFGRRYLTDESRPWKDKFERIDQLLNLGLDDVCEISAPLSYREDVKVRESEVTESGERYPLLVKEYETGKGTLRHVGRLTPDRPLEDGLQIFDDYGVPRARTKKYLVENMADIESLAYLFGEPDDVAIEGFRKGASQASNFARCRGVLTEGEGAMLGDAAMWLCGVERVVLATIRDREFLHRLLDVIHGWDMTRIRLLLGAGVDVVFHRGWYESAIFWSPKAYEMFLAPLILEEVEVVHKAGAKFGYIATREIMPLLGTYKELGIDLLFGPDPVEGNCDLHRVKAEVDGDICIWGGVNSAITLEQWDKERIGDVVEEAIRILGPGGGFVLGLVDAIFGRTAGTVETPASSMSSVIDRWRELRNYTRS
jgi:hypothetical protein